MENTDKVKELSEQVFTVKEVAENLSLSVYTIRNLIKKGNLKAAIIGNEYRITESAIKEFLESRATVTHPRRKKAETIK